MAVRPYKNKKGETIPGKWEIDLLPFGKKGPRFRRSFEGTETEALEREREFLRAAKKTKPTKNQTVKDALPEYLRGYRLDRQASTVKSCEDAFNNNLLAHFGHFLLSEIIPSDIDSYKQRRLSANVKRRTINKELSYFSGFLSWCVKRGYLDQAPYVERFPAKQTKAPTPRVPDEEQIEEMIRQIEPQYRPILLLMYDMGLRISEARLLSVSDVDIHGGLLFVRGKGEKERVLPITTRRLKVLLKRARRRAVKSENAYMFTNPANGKPYYSIRKAIIRAAKKAGIEGRMYHHLMRHSFGTHAIGAGVNLRVLQGMMGHSTSKVTEGYAQILAGHLKGETSKIEQSRKAASKGGGRAKHNYKEINRKSERQKD